MLSDALSEAVDSIYHYIDPNYPLKYREGTVAHATRIARAADSLRGHLDCNIEVPALPPTTELVSENVAVVARMIAVAADHFQRGNIEHGKEAIEAAGIEARRLSAELQLRELVELPRIEDDGSDLVDLVVLGDGGNRVEPEWKRRQREQLSAPIDDLEILVGDSGE